MKKVLLVAGLMVSMSGFAQEYPGSFYVGDIKGKICSITRQIDSTWVVKYTDTGKSFTSSGVPVDFKKAQPNTNRTSGDSWLESRSDYVISQYKKSGYVVVSTTVSGSYYNVVMKNGSSYTSLTFNNSELISSTHSN